LEAGTGVDEDEDADAVGSGFEGAGSDMPLSSRYACTRETNSLSVNASRFATMSSVMRAAGRVVKSKPARKAAPPELFSSLIRFESVGASEGAGGRFLDSEMPAALRFFSSAAAFSIRGPWMERISLI
jgi:hypothetical protein